MSGLRKISITFIGIAVVSVILSCSGHKFLKNDITPNGSIAVILAETRTGEVNVLLGDNLTRCLSEQTTLHVMQQSEVKNKLGKYPVKIKGPYTTANNEISVDYSKTDMDAIAAVAEKIGVQYLYVVWFPFLYELGNGKRYDGEIVAQMFEFPSRKEIARGDYTITWITGFSVGAYSNQEEATAGVAESVVKEIGANTGTLKK